MKFDEYLAKDFPFNGWLDLYIDATKVKSIFEIGACEAEDSIKLSHKFPMSSVYAFEPLPRNVVLCRKHIAEYSAKRVKLFEEAFSDKPGEATFFVSSGRPPNTADSAWDYGNKSSSLLSPKLNANPKWLKFNQKIKVKTKRLDDFCKKHKISNIDFLYMDVQGAELMVLKGAGDMLNHIKAIWLEVEAVELYKGQPLKKQVEEFMVATGFTCVMNTVGNVSGDQLYINNKLIDPKADDKLLSEEKQLENLERLIAHSHKAWSRANLSAEQYSLLEKQIEWLNIEWNKLRNMQSEAPLISVVMSVYNGGRFLEAAVKSVLAQSFSNFEFIIINDGSSDKSAAVILALKDPRVRLIHQVNHGLVYSLNKAVGLARSEFIARMDADDISLPSRFEKELSVMAGKPSVGVVGGFWRYIDENGKKSITIVTPTKSLDLKRSLYSENPFAHGTVLIRKVALEQAGGYRDDYGPTEDYDLWHRIADNWDFYQIPEVLYLYRISPTSISQTSGAVQAGFAAKIIHEQWHKPLFLKSYQQIIKDARYYQHLDSPFAQQIYNKYLDQQWLTILGLLGLGAFKSGFLNSLALVRLKPRTFRSLLRPNAGGLLRRLGLIDKRV